MNAPVLDRPRLHHPWLIGLGAMLVAFNLRPALTSVGPLLTRLREETGLSATGAAWLTTLPVLCLGLGGALAPPAIRRVGIDRGILVGVVILTVGLALRGLGELVSLFVGTALCGLGIGLAGVLLPALVKRDFAADAGRMTGLYTMMLCIGAATGTGLAVPVADWLGHRWAPALAFWSLPALAAGLAWAPFAKAATGAASSVAVPRPSLLRDPLAWQVTGFMGLQSSLAYIGFGWLPALLQGRSLSALEAGFLAALSTLGQAPGALIAATLAGRRRDQRGWIVGALLVTLIAFLALAFGPRGAMIPVGLVLGLAVGGCFGLGLSLIVLRAPDAATAGSLSAMAQGIGYAFASLGPFGFGLAHEATGSWGLPAALYAGIALAALACGLGAGRDRHVGRHSGHHVGRHSGEAS